MAPRLVEEDQIDKVKGLLDGAHSEKIILPSDIVVAEEFVETAEHKEIYVKDIPAGWIGLDVGRETSQLFAVVIRTAETVFWNGPMGVFEWEPLPGRDRGGGPSHRRGDGIHRGRRWRLGGGPASDRPRDPRCLTCRPAGVPGSNCWKAGVLPGVEVLERWAGGRDA